MSSKRSIATTLLLALCALAPLFQSCAPTHSRPQRGTNATAANTPHPSHHFEEYLRADFAPADGFDFPFGDGEGGGSRGGAREWEDSGPRHLSWGCVVLHLTDIAALYDQLPEGAMVVIF